MLNYNENGLINVGTGEEVTIKRLSNIISKVVNYKGNILWNKNKPDGTFRKLLDVSKINNLGWKSKIDLISGIESVYELVKNNNWK